MAREKIILSKEEVDKVRELAGLGLSIQKIAAFLGISKSTLDRRINEDESLASAIEQGRSKSISEVASCAYVMAISGKYPAMTMFWLKCRAGWSENSFQSSRDEAIPAFKIIQFEQD